MENSKEHPNKTKYTTFFLMLACSFVAMYITMYLNTYSIDHVYFSLTRFYMTCLGISAMAVIMWFFMRGMYKNRKKNIAIVTINKKPSYSMRIPYGFFTKQERKASSFRWGMNSSASNACLVVRSDLFIKHY